VYCDPPYQHTTGYRGTAPFDHAAFWETVRDWSRDNVVLVSEYTAPPDFICLTHTPKPSCLAGGHKQTPRVERLFVHESR
jgi:DNA adenine methylase